MMPWYFTFLVVALGFLGRTEASDVSPRRRLIYKLGDSIETARLYGNIEEYAYWFVHLSVGTPPQRVSVIADTGSTVAGFPCKACKHCGRHIDAPFDFESSSTASWVGCQDSKCHGSCSEGHCGYSQSYTEGSSIRGWWFEDVVAIGDEFQRNPGARMVIGCHMDENKLFYTQRANGIMGMAPRRNGGHPTVLDGLYQAPEIDKRIFSMCLAVWGGEMVVGGYNRTYHTDHSSDDASEITWIDMNSQSFYYISPTNLKIQNDRGEYDFMSSDFGQKTMVDSGTTYSYFPPRLYAALTRQIPDYCAKTGCGGARVSGRECWIMGSGGIDAFPTLLWEFGGGKEMHWVPSSYMHVDQKNANKWCYTFDDNRAQETVLGASWMINVNLIFDLSSPGQSRLGIAKAVCPEYRDRPTNAAAAAAPPETPSTTQRMETSPLPTTQAVSNIWLSTLAPSSSTSLPPTTTPAAAAVVVSTQAPTELPTTEQPTAHMRTSPNAQKGSNVSSANDDMSPLMAKAGAVVAALLIMAGCCVLCCAVRRRQEDAGVSLPRATSSSRKIRHYRIGEDDESSDDNEVDFEAAGGGQELREMPVNDWWQRGAAPAPNAQSVGHGQARPMGRE